MKMFWFHDHKEHQTIYAFQKKVTQFQYRPSFIKAKLKESLKKVHSQRNHVCVGQNYKIEKKASEILKT
jgi:hypothetical protein